MHIVVLGGAGIIGQTIARDLIEDVEQVVLADLDLEGARNVADSLGGRATALRVDVTDQTSLDSVLNGADACVNAVQYYFNLEVMQGCLRAQVPYLDLGGLFHTTRKQLELNEAFDAEGVTAILGLGSCPGVANVQAAYLASKVDTVDSVRIYNGSTLDEGESLSWAYSVETILDEITEPAMVFRNGRFEERPPLGEEEYFLFPDPIGYAKTHLSLHSEVATLPLSLAAKGIQECTFKITFFGYSEAALRRLQFLTELGFGSKELLEVHGVRVRPRDVLIALLKRHVESGPAPENMGFKDIATEVRGQKGAHDLLLRIDTWAWPHPEWGISGGKLMVASPPAIVARWLAARELERPGVWPPEGVVEAEPFFTELRRRGIQTSESRTEAFLSTAD